MRKLYPFSFVGCWNKPMPGIPLKGQPRRVVASALLAAQKSPDEVVILGGDNIYAVEGDKAKRHNEADFVDGAAPFEEANVFTAVGNHNLGPFADTGKSKVRVMAEEYGWLPSAAESYYRVPFEEADVIVLDTNQNGPAQSAWFMGQVMELAATGKPWWLVQHEPFASIKKIKAGKPKTHILDAKYVNGILPFVALYPPLGILCADTHNYQAGRLVMGGGVEIPQWVVGTGGGIPDRITGADVAALGGGIQSPLFYYAVDAVAPDFGFARVTGPGAVTFISVMPWPEQEGGARARPKNRRRTQSRWHHSDRERARSSRKRLHHRS
jgi:hypothetical protein